MVDSTDSFRLLRAVPVPREQDTSAGGYDQCEGYLHMISGQTDGHRPASRVIVQHPQERKGLFSHGYCQQYELNRQCKDETMASGALLSQSERFQEQNLSAFEERWICCLSRGLERHVFLLHLWSCPFSSRQHETTQGRSHFTSSSWVVRPKMSLTCPVSLLAALVKLPEEDSGD